MADAQASGACGSNTVWVQVPSSARFEGIQTHNQGFEAFFFFNESSEMMLGLSFCDIWLFNKLQMSALQIWLVFTSFCNLSSLDSP